MTNITNIYKSRKAAKELEKVFLNGKTHLLSMLPKPTGEKIDRPLIIGVDYDDTLGEFTSKICQELEKKFKHPFSYEECKWGFVHLPQEEREYAISFFNNPNFFANLPLRENSKKFVQEMVRRGHQLVFVTAAYTGCMTTRGEEIMKNFPDIPPCNIIITGRKDLVKLDILFDDSMKNIKSSIATLPVVVDQPWNQGYRGYVRVKDGLDYISIVDLVERGYTKQDILAMQEPTCLCERPMVVSIVGPSGAGKTAIVNRLETTGLFKRVVTNTTRTPRPGEPKDAYNYVSVEDFLNKISSSKLLEWSKYASHFYGTDFASIESVLASNKHALLVVDSNGAKAIKEAYPDNSVSIFINRNKESIVSSLLEREVPKEETVQRILQLQKDFEAITECQYSVENNSSLDKAVEKILSICSNTNQEMF